MDKLNLLKILMAVADQGSFANAAATLGLSPSAVSKAISRLESDLRLQLVYRTTRSTSLTEVGLKYLSKTRDIIDDLESYESSLQESTNTPKGLLKVNLPVSYGRQYILPLISEFKEFYPNIDIQLSFDDNYVDMIEQGIDVTVRSGTLEDSNFIAKQLSPMDFVVCGAPSYLRGKRKITPDTYDQHPWVRFRYKQSGRLHPIVVKKGNQFVELDPGQQFIVDDGEALAELCAQGLGLSQLPHFIAKKWLEEKTIKVIGEHMRHPQAGVWIIYAKREYLPEKVRSFVSFVESKIQEMGEDARHTWAEKYK